MRLKNDPNIEALEQSGWSASLIKEGKPPFSLSLRVAIDMVTKIQGKGYTELRILNDLDKDDMGRVQYEDAKCTYLFTRQMDKPIVKPPKPTPPVIPPKPKPPKPTPPVIPPKPKPPSISQVKHVGEVTVEDAQKRAVLAIQVMLDMIAQSASDGNEQSLVSYLKNNQFGYNRRMGNSKHVRLPLENNSKDVFFYHTHPNISSTDPSAGDVNCQFYYKPLLDCIGSKTGHPWSSEKTNIHCTKFPAVTGPTETENKLKEAIKKAMDSLEKFDKAMAVDPNRAKYLHYLTDHFDAYEKMGELFKKYFQTVPLFENEEGNVTSILPPRETIEIKEFPQKPT